MHANGLQTKIIAHRMMGVNSWIGGRSNVKDLHCRQLYIAEFWTKKTKPTSATFKN